MNDFRRINYEVMTDTKKKYESVPELKEAVKSSVRRQFMVAQEDNIDQPLVENNQTQYVCSGKRTLEAAKAYIGKKTAVLNFANNHVIGGAPFVVGTQEESLCRCSTLLPCLEAMSIPFYQKHIDDYTKGVLDAMGNDDLIYTPDVVVFKTDERTNPVYPKMMKESEWYKVDVITCAAPNLKYHHRPSNYEEIIYSRIKKILDVAAKEKVEVLILGAWGCGDFKNDSAVVSKTFYKLLKNYNFETVEFALCSKGDVSGSVFAFSPKYNDQGFDRITPDNITSLADNEVFVFGSNLQGHHRGGAARLAYQNFGAVWGLGAGLAGNSYAIPTMHGGVDAIKPYVDQFIEVARIMDSKIFYVTKIGCGIAGFKVEEIAPLFKDALELENVALPKEFVNYLRDNA